MRYLTESSVGSRLLPSARAAPKILIADPRSGWAQGHREGRGWRDGSRESRLGARKRREQHRLHAFPPDQTKTSGESHPLTSIASSCGTVPATGPVAARSQGWAPRSLLMDRQR